MKSKSNNKKNTTKNIIESKATIPAALNGAKSKETGTGLKKSKHRKPISVSIYKKSVPYIVIFVFTLLIYSQTFKYDYIYLDDDKLIVDNSQIITDISNIFYSLKTDLLFQPHGSYYRPLVGVTLTLVSQLSGSNYNIYHITNTIIHGLVCCLLFYLFLMLNFDKLISLISCLIFACHPLLVNSVCWIVGLNDLLIGLFFILSIIFLNKYIEKNNIKYIILHFVSFTLSLFSKETSLVFPILYIIFIILLHRNILFTLKTLNLVFIWAIPTTIFLILRSFIVSENNDVLFSFKNILTNLAVFPEIYKKIFLPLNLNPIPFYNNTSVTIGVILLIGTIIIITIQYLQQNKNNENLFAFKLSHIYSVFGLFLFLIVLLPGTLVTVGDGKYFDYLENRAYLPTVGAIMIFNSIIQYYISMKFNKKIFLTFGLVVIGLLSINTINLSKIYSDPLTFYQHAAKLSPNSALVFYNMGTISDKKFDYSEEAIDYYNKALKIKPNYPDALINKAVALGKLNRLNEANKCYDIVIELDPDNEIAWTNKGFIFEKLGLVNDAINCFEKAIALKPGDYIVWYNKGYILSKTGQNEQAIKYYNKSLKLNPGFISAWNNKGVTLQELGRIEEANKCFRIADELRFKKNK